MAVIFIVFTILQFTPGDAAAYILGNDYTEETGAQLRHELGIDRPLLVQYFSYIKNVLTGNFGTSYITKAPVMNQLGARIPNTFKIVIGATCFSILVSIPLGIIAADHPNSFISYLITAIALIGISMPTFWLGLMLILLFSVRLGWLPSEGLATPKAIILPAVTLGMNAMAGVMRTTRSSMIEAMGEDYVRTAKSKGVNHHDVLYKHVLRNALLPTVNRIGMSIGGLMGGSSITETIFSIAGVGRMMIDALNKRDTPSVLACLVVTTGSVGIMSIVVDLVSAFIDPRVKAKYVRK